MSELKTLFKRVEYDLDGLLHFIDLGDIALPDIQRPFVWSNAKVRDLFDSMYRGFPVGYFLFWENASEGATKQIGVGLKQYKQASRLVVDGQQRLTSLYAVFRGQKVLDANYKERQVEIAFRPRDGKFDVTDAAIRKDVEWIPNISDLWASGKSSYSLVNHYLKQLQTKIELSEDDREAIAHNLDRLFDLRKYPFTALEIASTVDEEQVADIFVRINSKGVPLNQADFILTLLSVFWERGRRDLETFCQASRTKATIGGKGSPFNHLIDPDPDQLLRVSIAYGFGRGRLQSVYQILRGKDAETGEFLPEKRDEQFEVLKAAQAEVLNLTNWHQFLSAIIGAGFRSSEMISSNNALLYAYAFYLMGRKRFAVPEHVLQKLIGRWFFATSLTGRYTSSPETVMDADLARFRTIRTADDFCATLDDFMASNLTNDYWTITLPSNLDSSSARNPELFCYIASQNLLGAPVLFSHKSVRDLIDPALQTKKKPLERHHLFPKAYLKGMGVEDRRLVNQMANYALLEWPDNIDISDGAPATYFPQVASRFGEAALSRMMRDHAMPEGWENMAYDNFLASRRRLMAAIIRQGFLLLEQGKDSHAHT
ncbi:GmrSD restriction endonuclease domain-containing protein [Paracoccus sp. KR1-242]|uniref:GmrSD restriction endonuclease domain-containing protein n=1 Tax=Paracoccus sp. KR1-242 TaxID=3410028 RepID=UPI003C0AB6AD